MPDWVIPAMLIFNVVAWVATAFYVAMLEGGRQRRRR